jgi:hypothetical protein
LIARFQRLQVIFEVVEKAHLYILTAPTRSAQSTIKTLISMRDVKSAACLTTEYIRFDFLHVTGVFTPGARV